MSNLNKARLFINAPRSGQSLIELIIGMVIATIIIAAASGAVALILKSNNQAKRLDTATNLARELSNNLRSFADASWFNVYDSDSNHHYLITSASPFTVTLGNETLVINGVTYTRYFSVERVNRDLCGAGVITTAATTTCASGPNTTGVIEDPSTTKVTIVATWPGTTTGVQLIEYLSRSRNTVTRQTDWSGGTGQEGPATTTNSFASSTDINYTGSAGSAQLSG
ncbi:MAG: prepilin-type N-terminal cleavage/methylation domain-containing protein, partial [bacterium]|nr:prepilin-type N-terminal cleavage/methylation domain-containing protein [bacterium]